MRRLILTLLLLSPAAALAQAPQEKLLPVGTQFYFHWEGYAPHWDGYKKTALGQMLQGETGTFLRALLKYSQEQARTVLRENLDAELVDTMLDELNGAVASSVQHGLVLGVEVRSIEPLDVQAVLIFPKGAGKTRSPLSLLNTLAKLMPGVPLQQIKKADRTITHVNLGTGHLAWWAEGKDAVLLIGTAAPEKLLERLQADDQRLTSNSLYKQVTDFDEFPTWCRGFLDLPALGKVVSKLSPEAPRLIEKLGLHGVQSLSFHMGFEGKAERAVTFLNLKGPRQGILRLADKKTFSLQNLPPMPNDLLGFTAFTLNATALYDVGRSMAEAVVQLADLGEKIQIKETIEDLEARTGVQLRQDIFNNLDSLVVRYSTSAEGILGLGQVLAIKVKDAGKLERALNKVFAEVQQQYPGALIVRTSSYRGAKLHLLDMGIYNSIYAPTFTIHKGWLVYSNYPQPIKGFILRANGDLPTWKASDELQEILAKYPKQLTGISVADPRPGVKLVLSVLPPILAGINSLAAQIAPDDLPQNQFDIRLIPNAYEATQPLFPNVTIYTDEGKRLRAESRSSLLLPF